MEEKKFDLNSIIGLFLIGVIFFWFSYMNQPEKPINDTEQKTAKTTDKKTKPPLVKESVRDSILPKPIKEEFIVLENEVLKLTFSNKGAKIIEALLKKYNTYEKTPLYLIKNNNANLNIHFEGINGSTFNTQNLIFQPERTQKNNAQTVSFKVKISDNQSITYTYTLKTDYMLDFSVVSQNIENVIDTAKPIYLNFSLKGFAHEKSIKYENQNTALYYEKEDYKYDDLSISGSDSEREENVNWIGFKQHFFSSILISEKPFKTTELNSNTLFDDETSIYTKEFNAKAYLSTENGFLNYNFNLYLGPNDYKALAAYDKGIENIVELGWGIFGWINKNAFIPLFDLLGKWFFNYGLVIILMTIVVRIFMSPLVYKSYLSSAKMKVLRPEMEEINQKYPGKENAMKRQQEIMNLQRKAGVSMLSGCIPALLQMPVFFALFRFFPSEIDLRGKSFLWAEDLSSYDSIYKLPFNIPLYGDHISLFPILASIAIFFYMKMSQNQQMNIQQPTQEGMPDMQKIMKMMIYLSPIMMLIFFNSYGAGLSLYYFISNVLTLTIMFVIKNWIIDEDKIHAQIQENKKRPEKKKGKFRQRLEEAMKEAQKRQELQKKRR